MPVVKSPSTQSIVHSALCAFDVFTWVPIKFNAHISLKIHIFYLQENQLQIGLQLLLEYENSYLFFGWPHGHKDENTVFIPPHYPQQSSSGHQGNNDRA